MTEDAEVHAEYALWLEKAQDNTGAHRAYARAWHMCPESSRYAAKAGVTAEVQGQLIAAAQWYETALSLSHPGVWIWNAYGRVSEKLGEWGRAGYAYQQYAKRAKRQDKPVLEHEGGKLSLDRAIRFGALPRPDYAHAVRHAALLARQLEIPSIKVAELGVASGRGLLVLHQHAMTLERLTGVKIHVWGFDTGTGLPVPTDYRDMPHFFGEGDYTAQDPDELRRRTEDLGIHLILGDAVDSFAQWAKEGPPIGAVLFDMDTYSSTAGVLRCFGDQSDDEHFLPRVSIGFDDLLPKDAQYNLKDYSSFTGEAAAIQDFNEENQRVKLDPDRYWIARPEHLPWFDSCYLLHRFDHPQYNTRIRESAVEHRPLQ